MKSVRVWTFSGPNAGKYRPEKLQIARFLHSTRKTEFESLQRALGT